MNRLRVPQLPASAGLRHIKHGQGSISLLKSQSRNNVDTSSVSSKRNAFRNKLKMSGGLSDYAPFNKFRADSSVSSKFVIKVDDKLSEAEFL